MSESGESKTDRQYTKRSAMVSDCNTREDACVKEDISHLGLQGSREGREAEDRTGNGSLKNNSKEGMSMQFMPKGMQLKALGPQKPQMGVSMQMGGKSLAELSQMQGKRDGKSLQSFGAIKKQPGAESKAGMGLSLSDLAAGRVTGTGVQEPVMIGKGVQMPSKAGPPSGLSLADIAEGAGSGTVKESSNISTNIPQMVGSRTQHSGNHSGLSLADIAEGAGSGTVKDSSNISTNIPQMVGSKTQFSGNVSLADLASGHLSSSPTLQQGNLGKTGMKTKQLGAMSLGDLASSHSSVGNSSLMANLQKNVSQPGKQTNASSGKSLADLASGHLSSSPKTVPTWDAQNMDQSSGIKAKQTGGVSLADLASGHLPSPPNSLPFGRTQSMGKTPAVQSKQIIGPSLSDLAALNFPVTSTALESSGRSNHQTKPISIKKKAKLNKDNSLSSSPLTTDQAEIKPTHADHAQKRVPPGFESMFHLWDPSAPSEGLSTTPPSSPPLSQLNKLPSSKIPPYTTDVHNQPEPTRSWHRLTPWDSQEDTFPESQTGRRAAGRSKETSSVMSPPSSFGMALCLQCQDPPARVDAIAQGRVGYHGVQRRVLHRQFSFERQKSRQEMVEEKKWLSIKPFDFSRPSPDDCVRQRQSGAFQPLYQSKIMGRSLELII